MSARTSRRTLLSLDGVWKFKTDPNDVGEKSNWHSTSLDDSDWDEIRVPSVWESCGYVDYDGTAWYRKRFNLSTVFAGKRTFVEFGAVDYLSKIWINSIFLGEHEGGYTPFKFDVTDAIKIGAENTIVVTVYDPNKKPKDFPPTEIMDGKSSSSIDEKHSGR
jgi:beta-galactosidase/beta-glucuronidase